MRSSTPFTSLGSLPAKKGVRDIDIFVEHDPRRDFEPRQQFIGAGAQHGAQHRLEPRPRVQSGASASFEQRIEIVAVGDGAAHDVGEQRVVGLAESFFVLAALAQFAMTVSAGASLRSIW